MSGRDERSEPIEAASENGEQEYGPLPPAPPSFGQAGPPSPVPGSPFAEGGRPWWAQEDSAGSPAASATGHGGAPPAAAGPAEPGSDAAEHHAAEFDAAAGPMPPPPWLAAEAAADGVPFTGREAETGMTAGTAADAPLGGVGTPVTGTGTVSEPPAHQTWARAGEPAGERSGEPAADQVAGPSAEHVSEHAAESIGDPFAEPAEEAEEPVSEEVAGLFTDTARPSRPEPALVPDAILPPGTLPEAVSGPPQEPIATRTVPDPADEPAPSGTPEDAEVMRPDELVPWLEALPDDDIEQRLAARETAAPAAEQAMPGSFTAPAATVGASARQTGTAPPPETPFGPPVGAPGGPPPAANWPAGVPGEFPGNAPGSAGTATPATGTANSSKKGNRPLLLAAGGGALAVIVGVAALIGLGPDDSGPDAQRTAAEPAGGTAANEHPSIGAQPTPTQSTPTRDPQAESRIDNAKTDPKPLAMSEVFPEAALALAGRQWRRDGASVNHNCALAARGEMAESLIDHGCRSVLRATFVNRNRVFAITTGVAVLPTKADAVAVGKAGDPERYEWFRGMRSKAAGEIDQAGGYASSTVRGRYVVYAYAQYVDGIRPKDTPPSALPSLTRQFIDYAVRPIDARAR